jgi:uncharacterized membrane protein YeiH
MVPEPNIPAALELLDIFGIAVFAVSGALLAAEKRQTLVTFIFFAVATGVGGGTLRDLLIGARRCSGCTPIRRWRSASLPLCWCG